MKTPVTAPYLKLPVGYHAPVQKVLFFCGAELVFDLDIQLSPQQPNEIVCLDVRRFLGKGITVECEQLPDYRFAFADKKSVARHGEEYRPLVHFAAEYGWLNDPNGLVYLDGIYHLFHQHNPAGSNWGNMHWGHAVSHDLLHWCHKEDALHPDQLGTMFSGSAIIDTENVSQLGDGSTPPMLLFYTAAGGTSRLSEGKPFTQCMAYSLDRGETFTKYPLNPIIPHRIGTNRDPKVTYCPPLQAYVMALYLDEHQYGLLVSTDLRHWDLRQEVYLEGDTECPDFYPLPGPDGGERWVLSGGSDYYLIGDFRDGRYVPHAPARRLRHGKRGYAAQTFSGVPGTRRLRIAWNRTRVPDSSFNCSMCFPEEMSVQTVDGEEHLCAWPLATIESLYADTMAFDGAPMPFATRLKRGAYDISLTLSVSENARCGLSFFGMMLTLDVSRRVLHVNEEAMPLPVEEGKIALRIIIDTLSAEIYAGRGEACLCAGFVMDYAADQFTVSARAGDVQIDGLVFHSLLAVL